MKKIYLLLAATAVLGACSESDVIKEVVENEVAIGFNGGFVDNTTRAFANISGNNYGDMGAAFGTGTDAGTSTGTLCQDGNTIEVWGWKTANGATTPTKLFDNQTVTYKATSSSTWTTTTTKWEYSPLKYWDKAATYMFYATSPKGAFDLVEDDSDPTKRLFSVTGVPSVQVLFNNNSASLVKEATATHATGESIARDLLVADVENCGKGTANQAATYDKDVVFTFHHILSKLNVNVETTDVFASDGTKYPQIKLTKLTLSFGQYTPATLKADGTVDTPASWVNRWYDTGDVYKYQQTTAGVVQPVDEDDDTKDDVWTITDNNVVATSDVTNSYISFLEDESGTGTTTVEKKILGNITIEDYEASIASYFVAPTQISETAVNHVYVTAEYDIIYDENVKDEYGEDTGEKLVEHCVSEMTEVQKVVTPATYDETTGDKLTDDIYGPAFPSFVQNNVYTLDVVIGPRAIYFDVEVDGWDDGDTGTVIVE